MEHLAQSKKALRRCKIISGPQSCLLLFTAAMKDSKISLEQVRHVADLARLHLSDNEMETMRRQLNTILDYMDSLAELDVDNVEPIFYSVAMEAPLRPDRITSSLCHDDAMRAAPENRSGAFVVPKVLDGES